MLWLIERLDADAKIDFLVDEVARSEAKFPTEAYVRRLSSAQHTAFLETHEPDERNLHWRKLKDKEVSAIDQLFIEARSRVERRVHELFRPLDKAASEVLARLDWWTLDEAVALLAGFVPQPDQLDWAELYDDEIDIAVAIIQRRDLVERALASGVVPNPIVPTELVRWWKSKNKVLAPELNDLLRSPAMVTPRHSQERPSAQRKLLALLWIFVREKYGDQVLEPYGDKGKKLFVMIDTNFPGIDRKTIKNWLRVGKQIAELRSQEPDVEIDDSDE